ncbi:hypothetical protein O181_102225 [Austropuccinia psidii MF-1]|uniref:Uncharacterized protein n=1 Tax=Austropuccinia psidii MF-1 TaxID=1389203 RepID=A0A9Q3JJ63_9BASI|nr:hypothetical protein [Austropuccinia psidii MF-1]
MSDLMINMKVLRKCGGELEHDIKCRSLESCSTEECINFMEDIITRNKIGKTCTRNPIESKIVSETFRQDRRPERHVLECIKCRSTSHLKNTCTKNTKINEVQVIDKVHCAEEKEESDQDSVISGNTPVVYYPIENITAFFEVTEVYTHLPQYSKDCYNPINIQDFRICKSQPARGKGYTAVTPCITPVLLNGLEAQVNLDTGELCTCVGKDFLQNILHEWKNHLLLIEGVQFSSSSKNMYHLGIFETNIVFPHPAGSVIMKTAIVVMDNFTSQNAILGNYYLNIYFIDINNHKDRFFTIEENKRQKFSFSNISKQI